VENHLEKLNYVKYFSVLGSIGALVAAVLHLTSVGVELSVFLTICAGALAGIWVGLFVGLPLAALWIYSRRLVVKVLKPMGIWFFK